MPAPEQNSESRTATTAHTPGPWSVSEWGVTGATGDVLEVVQGFAYDEFDSEPACINVGNDADARLIAAAPDMLTMLKDILNECDLLENNSAAIRASSISIIRMYARAAITKATGSK